MQTKEKYVIGFALVLIIVGSAGMAVFFTAPQPRQTATILIRPQLQGPVGSIYQLTIKQYIGSSWITMGTLSTTGGSVQVYADYNTRFEVTVSLAHDYASTSGQAMTNTRCYITITGIISDTLMTAISATEIPDVLWYVLHRYDWTDSGYPIAGVTYTLSFEYQAYY